MTGRELWRYQFPAPTREPLDYGNSPRATPLIEDGRVFLLGAFGHLHCLAAATGDLIWTSDLAGEFAARPPKWGYTASPLIVAGKLILQPGGAKSAIVALDPETGDLLWESPGRRPAYASPIVATIAGKTQLIAYDSTGLTARDPATGAQLWELKPEHDGDFNVPTPFLIGSRLFTTTEGNGARLFEFDATGKPAAKPAFTFDDLSPDTHSPVPVGKHIAGLDSDLFCLDAATLRPAWKNPDHGLGDYAAILSDGKTRLLAFGENGLLALYDTASPRPLATLKVSEEDYCLAHPALVGNRLYLRLGKRIVRTDL